MTSPVLSDSRLANVGARAIAEAHSSFDARFRIITRRARIRFEERDWKGMAADASQRLDVYGKSVSEAVVDVGRLLGDRVRDKMVWAAMKAVYSGLIQERDDWELAETFFNSVTRRIFTTVGVDHQMEFVDTDFDSPPHEVGRPVYRSYVEPGTTAALIRSIITDTNLDVSYRSLERDCTTAAGVIGEHLRRVGALRVIDRAEVAEAVFSVAKPLT